MDERSLWALRIVAALLTIGLILSLFADGCGRMALDTRAPAMEEDAPR